MSKKTCFHLFAFPLLALLGLVPGCISETDLRSDKFPDRFVMPKMGCITGVWIPSHSSAGGLHKNSQTKAGPDCRPMQDDPVSMCWEWKTELGETTGWYGEGCLDKSNPRAAVIR